MSIDPRMVDSVRDTVGSRLGHPHPRGYPSSATGRYTLTCTPVLPLAVETSSNPRLAPSAGKMDFPRRQRNPTAVGERHRAHACPSLGSGPWRHRPAGTRRTTNTPTGTTTTCPADGRRRLRPHGPRRSRRPARPRRRTLPRRLLRHRRPRRPGCANWAGPRWEATSPAVNCAMSARRLPVALADATALPRAGRLGAGRRVRAGEHGRAGLRGGPARDRTGAGARGPVRAPERCTRASSAPSRTEAIHRG